MGSRKTFPYPTPSNYYPRVSGGGGCLRGTGIELPLGDDQVPTSQQNQPEMVVRILSKNA